MKKEKIILAATAYSGRKRYTMTNREFLTAIANMENISEELKAEATARIEKLDATNEARKNKPSKKAIENAPVMEQIANEILTSEDGPLELSSHDGLIMPNIKMVADERFAHINPDRGVCPFLNAQGRCSIHPIRTGLCRLYPLGRNFYPNKLTYFILNEDLGCPAKNKSYIRISDWLEIADLDQYEAFQLKWHQIKLQTRAKMHDPQLSFETKKTLSIRFLNCFYKTPYPQDFYQEFYKRADAFTIQSVQNEV